MLAVLEHAQDLAGVRQVTLTYTEGNVAAERLYRSCGFETFGHEFRAVVVNGVDVTKVHMTRLLDRADGSGAAISLDGVKMARTRGAEAGSVGPDDHFIFEQVGDVVSARYGGGTVIDGYLIGHLRGRLMHFRYVQARRDGGLDAGVSDASIEMLTDGRLQLREDFTWLTRPGRGTNVFEELEHVARDEPVCM